MKKVLLFSFLVSAMAFFGCGDDSTVTDIAVGNTSVSIKLSNLPALTDSAKYCAWVYADDASSKPYGLKSIGVLNAKNGSIDTTFSTNLGYLQKAKYFVITIESAKNAATVTTPGAPILACSFESSSANLVSTHSIAFGSAMSNAMSGSYVLNTPTDNTASGYCGIWFTDATAKVPSLVLPSLPANWSYKGWIKDGDKYISTGLFTELKKADSTYYCNGKKILSFPGEDFLFDNTKNPSGFSFPYDLRGKEVMITIEPAAEYAVKTPFPITFLKGTIAADASLNTSYNLDAVTPTTLPTGTVSFNTNIY
jgi:hypothetical protein